MTRRVLVTGATGFIGARTLAPLRARGFEVHALGRSAPADPHVVHHAADLLDPVATRAAVAAARASHLVHMAWYVEPGAYWRSPRNLDWVAASLHLARCFTEAGGQRLVAAGTCAEYAWGPDRLAETASACEPATLYGACKDALRRTLAAFGEAAPLSVAWGRVFFLYGPNEAGGRLVSDAARALLSGQRFGTSHGRQRRDFSHVDDVAAAFAALAASDVRGPVNVASGTAVPVRAVLETVARHAGGAELLDFGARPLAPTEPAVIEAVVQRLHHEVGFRPRHDLDGGIADTVAWWRAAAA
jgi:nucleoside-diphosphate-sugar epimerase